MLIEFSVLDTKDFSVEHIFDTPANDMLIQHFSVGKNAYGLEAYLKEIAADDERDNQSRTYLVKDKVSGELVCYFSLRTGLITRQVKDEAFDSLPAIELSNFAVDEHYKAHHQDVKKIGYYIFKTFVIPLTQCIAKYIGVHALYIYALPNDKLIDHYRTMGFSRLPADQEQFVQTHVKPKYDEGCIFMYQTL